MKKYILYFILLLSLSLQFSCKKEADKKIEVNKVVNDFFKALNDKDFEKMKSVSNDDVDKYIDFIMTFGDDLVEIDSVIIQNTKIVDKKAAVRVETIDIYGYKIFYQLSLTKELTKWKLSEIEGFTSETKLTKDEIKYTKKKQAPKDSLSEKVKTKSEK
jgi:hypothetical protein